MHPLPFSKLNQLRKNWLPLLAFGCLLTVVLFGHARIAGAQEAEFVVTITRPSEGETFYAGVTSLLYSTPISGRVSSARFRPEEIAITLAIFQDGRLMNSLEATPKADGLFSFNVTVNPEGSSEIFGPDILYCAEYCHFQSEVALPAGDVQLVVTATDPAGRYAESERHIVVDLSGQAVVPVKVMLEGQPGLSLEGIPVSGSTRLYLWRARHHVAATGPSGEALVAVEALAEAPTRYTFYVEPSIVDGVLFKGTASVEVVLPPGATNCEPVNLTVLATLGQITGKLAGRSVTLPDSFPVAAIRLPSGSVNFTQASAEGSFAFTDMSIDRYLLAADNAALVEQGLFVAGLPVDLSQNVQVNVQMPVVSVSGESSRGSVLDTDGNPLPFAWLATGDQVQSVLPDSGQYLFPDLPDGTKSLIVTAPGFYSQAIVIEASPGDLGESEVRLVQQPGTERVAWGNAEVVVPADSKVAVSGDHFVLEHGWLWGQGDGSEPIFISAGSTSVVIESGVFALEYRSNLRSWFYLMAGEAQVLLPDEKTPLQLQAGEMINLWHGDLSGDHYEAVSYDPVVVTALQPSYSSSPVPTVWEQTLAAQIRDRLAQVGIGAAQSVTFITYLSGIISVVAGPLIVLYWRWSRSRSTIDQSGSYQ